MKASEAGVLLPYHGIGCLSIVLYEDYRITRLFIVITTSEIESLNPHICFDTGEVDKGIDVFINDG